MVYPPNANETFLQRMIDYWQTDNSDIPTTIIRSEVETDLFNKIDADVITPIIPVIADIVANYLPTLTTQTLGIADAHAAVGIMIDLLLEGHNIELPCPPE